MNQYKVCNKIFEALIPPRMDPSCSEIKKEIYKQQQQQQQQHEQQTQENTKCILSFVDHNLTATS